MEMLPENAGCTAGPGHENDELEWGKRNIPDAPHVILADRVTALHDIPLAPGLEKFRKKACRRMAARPRHTDDRDDGT